MPRDKQGENEGQGPVDGSSRKGARELLQAAIEAERDAFLASSRSRQRHFLFAAVDSTGGAFRPLRIIVGLPASSRGRKTGFIRLSIHLHGSSRVSVLVVLSPNYYCYSLLLAHNEEKVRKNRRLSWIQILPGRRSGVFPVFRERVFPIFYYKFVSAITFQHNIRKTIMAF